MRQELQNRNVALEGELVEQRCLLAKALAELQEVRDERAELQRTYAEMGKPVGHENSEQLAVVQRQHEENRNPACEIESLYVELHSARAGSQIMEEKNQKLAAEVALLQVEMQATMASFQ